VSRVPRYKNAYGERVLLAVQNLYVKVKYPLEQAMKAQRKSRGIALFFL
jgi:hypothetical protein